jgi:hypothetical protein
VVWPVVYKLGPAVDASGKLADGSEFAGLTSLARHLAADPRRLARGFVRHLACYVTGAEIGYADRRVVDSILDATAASGYGVRSLIQAVAASELMGPP